MSWSKVVPRATRMPGLRAVEAFSRHSFAPHAHDEFGLGMVLSGGHVSLSRVGRVEAEPRDVINVNPGEVHDGAPLGDAPRAWLMVYIDPPALAEGLGREPEFPDLNGLEFVAPVLRSPGLADKFGELYALLTQPAAEDEVALEGDLLEVLVRSLRPRARASSGALCSARVLRVLERMRDDPAAAVTLADLAEVAGMSRYQVLRGVKRATGLTPQAFLRQLRVDRARRAILRGSTLAEAAAEAGFCDQSHMNRAFKGAYGVTPGAFARSVGPSAI